MAQHYKDLIAWQKEMVATLYDATEAFPKRETYSLTDQMRRAAVSIPSNIAEGQGRLNTREFRQFLGIARGSTCELQTQLDIARRLALGNPQLLQEAESLSHEIGKMIFTILRKLKTTNS